MILHLVEDEKVINRTIALFEEVNKGNNKFLIDIPSKQHELKHVKKTSFTFCAVYETEEYWNAVEDINQYQAVIIHSLTTNMCDLVRRHKDKKVPFVWILWGADLYNYLATQGYKLYLWKPNLFQIKLRWLFYDWLTISIQNLRAIAQKKHQIKALYEIAYKRVDYCCIFNKGDYDLLKHSTDTNAKWLWFNYYPIDSILGPKLLNKKVNGGNIFLNNSGSITGNHIAAYKLLAKFNLQGRKVITPLSYGNSGYCQLLIKEGHQKLGSNFFPLKDFMPLDEYNNYLCSASIMIMFHLRQEAVGNIIISLYLGAKVYLHEENNLFNYFKSIGVKVFSITKDLTKDNPNALEPLPADLQLNNRRKVLAEFNEARIVSKTKLLLQEVLKNDPER